MISTRSATSLVSLLVVTACAASTVEPDSEPDDRVDPELVGDLTHHPVDTRLAVDRANGHLGLATQVGGDLVQSGPIGAHRHAEDNNVALRDDIRRIGTHP